MDLNIRSLKSSTIKMILSVCFFSLSRLMRSAKYYLEKDMKDKFSAMTIDKNCTAMNNKSPHIYFTDQSAKIEGK